MIVPLWWELQGRLAGLCVVLIVPSVMGTCRDASHAFALFAPLIVPLRMDIVGGVGMLSVFLIVPSLMGIRREAPHAEPRFVNPILGL